RAEVWMPTDIPKMNLRQGPGGDGAFESNELVTCDYVERRKQGTTRKFFCALAGGEIVKVRYGVQNREVEGSVLATRLLWALGFPADRVYPVRVRCRGCSSDPWNSAGYTAETHDFDVAAIERKPAGHEMMRGKKRAGWSWTELDLIGEDPDGVRRTQRDAL